MLSSKEVLKRRDSDQSFSSTQSSSCGGDSISTLHSMICNTKPLRPNSVAWNNEVREELNRIIRSIMEKQERKIESLDHAINYRQDVLKARMESSSSSISNTSASPTCALGISQLLDLDEQMEQACRVSAQLHCLAIEVWTSPCPVNVQAKITAILSEQDYLRNELSISLMIFSKEDVFLEFSGRSQTISLCTLEE